MFKISSKLASTICFKSQKDLFRLLRRTFLTAQIKEIDQLEHLNGKKFDCYEKLHAFSIQHPDLFWGTMAKSRLAWFRDFKQVQSGSFKQGQIKWFLDGQLNASVNCVDRHYIKEPNRIALIWEKDEPGFEERVTYRDLYTKMNQMANMLKSCGVQKGDRVAIYMTTSPMAVATMLACARIGAVHTVVFAGFSAESLAARINDSQAKVVVTMNEALRGGKTIDLKKTVDAAVSQSPSVKHVLVVNRTQNTFQHQPKDILIDEKKLSQYSADCTPEIMGAEDPLFILYTSGSTGKPKGIVHTHGGYLLYTALSFQLVFDYKINDVFGCLADVGWITGHSYIVYAPLLNGGTSVLFESTPTYPDPGRYWQTVERLKINQLYIAPTSIRVLMKYSDEWVKKYDRSSLKCLGSVGEPINSEAWHWYNETVGENRCKIADSWWQTETGGISICPLPSNLNSKSKPTYAQTPFLGINAVLLDEKGKEIQMKNSSGLLCIKQPWPGIGRTINGDHSRFIDTYLKPFPGYYFTGDGALCDNEGNIKITGRVDDVMNVSGHRIGTAEVEDALGKHVDVAESAVVSFPHDTLGEGIFAFVVLKNKSQLAESDLIIEMKNLVKTKISSFAVPQQILIISNLPKTRSGKIMRRILRKIAANQPDDLGDITTLSEPAVVNEILEKYLMLKSN